MEKYEGEVFRLRVFTRLTLRNIVRGLNRELLVKRIPQYEDLRQIVQRPQQR
jgi:hypothetical protein